MVDHTKFPFPGVEHPHAATLTEAIAINPVDAGFIVIAVKPKDGAGFEAIVRTFAQNLRAGAAESGLKDVTAYREILREELGGAVPFDQAICDAVVQNATERAQSEADLLIFAES